MAGKLGSWSPYLRQTLGKYFFVCLFVCFCVCIFWLRWVFIAPRAFSSCSEQGLLFVAVRGLLIVVASLAAEHGLQACGLQ